MVDTQVAHPLLVVIQDSNLLVILPRVAIHQPVVLVTHQQVVQATHQQVVDIQDHNQVTLLQQVS